MVQQGQYWYLYPTGEAVTGCCRSSFALPVNLAVSYRLRLDNFYLPERGVVQGVAFLWRLAAGSVNLVRQGRPTANSQTGQLTITPVQLGQYVVGVCVREYRNGVLIGTHRRDFQFNVTNCITNVNAAIDPPPGFTQNNGTYYGCNGLSVDFTNSSVNGTVYSWNFGDPSTQGDTSHLSAPSYTYATSGIYQVQLIVNPGYFCADTDYVTISVRNDIDIDFTVTGTDCIDDNLWNFSLTGVYSPNTSFTWGGRQRYTRRLY